VGSREAPVEDRPRGWTVTWTTGVCVETQLSVRFGVVRAGKLRVRRPAGMGADETALGHRMTEDAVAPSLAVDPEPMFRTEIP